MQYEHRISSSRIRFLNEEGKILKNQEIAYRLKNHEFLFGCGAFDSLPAADPGEGNKFRQDRMEKWLAVFNYGTLPFYWGEFEPTEGKPLTESRMRAARLLRSHGVTVKGHPLCWHTLCADWLLQYDDAAILRKQLDRIHRDVSAFRGVAGAWDVINEAVIMPEFDRYDNAVTRICRAYGRVELIKMVFEAAREADPDAVLLINDFNLSDRYRELIARCLDAGAPISAIGLQTHQHQGYMGRERLEEVLERFSVFGLPLHFTENTLVSGQLMPGHIVDLNDYQVDDWPSTPEGEQRQRQQWREMYEILFAHPLVEAVTGWDFADGAWLNAPSGLLRKDNSPKPAYHELKKMIHEEWSSSGNLRTDENGVAELRGFRGEYSFSSPTGEGSCLLKRNAPECTVVLTK